MKIIGEIIHALRRAFLLLRLRAPAGDGAGNSGAEHQLGEYPMIVLTWEDAMRGAMGIHRKV